MCWEVAIVVHGILFQVLLISTEKSCLYNHLFHRVRINLVLVAPAALSHCVPSFIREPLLCSSIFIVSNAAASPTCCTAKTMSMGMSHVQ